MGAEDYDLGRLDSSSVLAARERYGKVIGAPPALLCVRPATDGRSQAPNSRAPIDSSSVLAAREREREVCGAPPTCLVAGITTVSFLLGALGGTL